MHTSYKTSISVLIGLLVISSNIGAESWKYSSLLGDETFIINKQGDGYAVNSYDVTRIVNCEDSDMALCFGYPGLFVVAIPKEEPKLNDKWVELATTFSAVKKLDEFNILGHEYKDVLIIEGIANYTIGKDDSNRSKCRFAYSYSKGVLAFWIPYKNIPGLFVSTGEYGVNWK